MQHITSASGLREAIILLENKRKTEEAALREQLRTSYESIKPINLIKNTYQDILASHDLKDSLINTSIGLTAGYISKALFEGRTHSPIKKLLGTALLFGITNAVRKNPEAIKAFASTIFRMIRSNSDRSSPITHTRIP